MSYINSPLRYPGGKSSLSRFLARVIEANGFMDCVYVEPFAGGAGAALDLLLNGIAKRICLNDADPLIHAFWMSCLNNTENFLQAIHDIPVTIDEWHKQRIILRNPKNYSLFERGFAAFFMNRTNRSGILNGGPIGGQNQTGKWKIDARFNRSGLAQRIIRIAQKSHQIDVHGLDAMTFLGQILPSLGRKIFIYFDPPYYQKGQMLYLNSYRHEDHAALADFLKHLRCPWTMTYDNAAAILEMYEWCRIESFDINYFASKACRGKEVFISPKKINLPKEAVLVQYNTGKRFIG